MSGGRFRLAAWAALWLVLAVSLSPARAQDQGEPPLPLPDVPPHLAGQDFALTATISSTAPMVGQALRYRLRLFRSRAVAAIELRPPTAPEVSVHALPGQRDTIITVGGRHYTVTAVTYLLTPTKAGRIELGPGTAVCRIDAAGHNRLTVQSAPVVLDVQATAAGAIRTEAMKERTPVRPAGPRPREKARPAMPLSRLPASADRDAAPPDGSIILAGGLLGPILGLLLVVWGRGRRQPPLIPMLAPQALAEALRAALDRTTPQRQADMRTALETLDRLLYAGTPVDPQEMAAAVTAGMQALRRETAA